MIFLLDSRWPDPCFIHFYEIKIYQDLWLGLPSIRINSPIHRTMEVPAKIRPQSVQLSGTTLNILPPKVTMRYCLGVEHVPELEKNEDGEEQGQFVRCQCMFRG